MEEYLAARIWPLTSGWFPVHSHHVKFDCVDWEVAFPIFVLSKPEGKSDEVIVAELKMVASELLGPWNKKEYDSFFAVCCHQGQVNRCLHEMGVSYEVRVVSPLPHRRLRAPGVLGSEVPVKKSKGKSYVEFAETSAQVFPSKAARIPTAKQSASQAEARKRKTIEDNRPQVILDKDLGTSLFMKELRKTEGGGSCVPEGRRWSIRYDLNQFGTTHTGSGRFWWRALVGC